MCNHTHAGKPCPFAIENLPHDPQSNCIFHSKDADWKRKNDFSDWLNRALQQGISDFRAVVFVAERENGTIEFTASSFQSLAAKQRVSFEGAVFLQPVEFRDAVLNGGAVFKQTLFKQTAKFANMTIEGLDFTQAEFWETVHFDKLMSKSYAWFNQAVFTNGLKMEHCAFHNQTSFEMAQFRSRNVHKTHIDFKQTVFHYEVDFNKAVFNAPVFFDTIEFKGATTFEETLFDVPNFEAGYYQAVNFERISLGENAAIQFSGTPSEKLFKQSVCLDITNWQGIVNFENVDFFRLDQISRNDLFQKQKENKVFIGVGCIKYRLCYYKTVTETNISLDIAQTFVNYFNSVENGINLGVEIQSNPQENTKQLLYFSDADISQADFEQRLMRADETMWTSFVTPEFTQQIIGTGAAQQTEISLHFAKLNVWVKFVFDRVRLGLLQQYDLQTCIKIMEGTSISPNVPMLQKEKTNLFFQTNIIQNTYNVINGNQNTLVSGVSNSDINVQNADKIYNIGSIDNANFK